MSETEFPQFGHHWRNEHVYGEVEAFDIGAVESWFKRCLEDKPNPEDIAFNLYYNFTSPPVLFMHLEIKYLKAFESWYEKWFSQFNEKGEDE